MAKEELVELVAKITADSTSLQKDLSDAEKKAEVSSKNIADSFRKVGIAFAASGAAITGALGLMTKSAMEVESTRGAFDNLAKANGQSADSILESMKKASAGTISANDLMLAANKAMTLGVAKNTSQFTTLMEIARDRARAMGLTTTQAFSDIVTGLGRGSALILDNLGILVNVTDANKVYADSIGKTASELTEAEQKQALLNQVLTQGQKTIDRQALATLTASESYNAMKASVADLSAQLGQTFLPIVQSAGKFIVSITKSVSDWSKEHPVLSDVIGKVALVLGVLMTIVGGAILTIPKLVESYKAFKTVIIAVQGNIVKSTVALVTHIATTISAQIATYGLVTAIGVLVIELAVLAAGVAMVVWGISTLIKQSQDEAKITELNNRLSEEHAKALKGEENEYATLLQQVKDMGGTLDAESEAYLEATKQAEIHGIIGTTAAESVTAAEKETTEEIKRRLELRKEELTLIERYAGTLTAGTLDTAVTIGKMISGDYGATPIGGGHSKAWETAVNDWRTDPSIMSQYHNVQDYLNSKGIAYKEGGVVPGTIGQPQLAVVHGGETVTPPDKNTNEAKPSVPNDLLSISINKDIMSELSKITSATIESIKPSISLASGGVVPGSVGQPQLAVVHGGETVTPPEEINSGMKIPQESLSIQERKMDILSGFYKTTQLAIDSIKPSISLASGGVVPGGIGEPIIATVHGGETVIPPNDIQTKLPKENPIPEQQTSNVTINFTEPIFLENEASMSKLVNKISDVLNRNYRLRFGSGYAG